MKFINVYMDLTLLIIMKHFNNWMFRISAVTMVTWDCKNIILQYLCILLTYLRQELSEHKHKFTTGQYWSFAEFTTFIRQYMYMKLTPWVGLL